VADAISQAFDECERIGVIGSPSSTSFLTIDLLGTAVDKRLVGALCVFNFKQDGAEHFALGQVSEVRLRNPWTEDPTMRGLIRQKGSVDPVTEKQDTHNATIYLSAVFSKASQISGSMLGTVPPTGTSVRLASERVLNELLHDYRGELFFLGHAFGTKILLPMWFKHFGEGTGGAGEAYHIGIFGKTGSGKSVLAKMILLGYARHSKMSVIVLDPQGEFSKMGNDPAVKTVVEVDLKRSIDTYDLSNIVLTDSPNYELFLKTLTVSDFFRGLSIFSDENKVRAVWEIRNAIKSGQQVPPKPWEIFQRLVFDRVWRALGTPEVQRKIYTMQELQARLAAAHATADIEEFYGYWSRIGRLFANDGRTKYLQLKRLIPQVVSDDKGAIVVLDLSETNVPDYLYWSDEIRLVVINRILETLKDAAESKFKEGKLSNTLVIIDEAHRLAPKFLPPEDLQLATVRRNLVDGALTTRKFGLGWMFISPTISSIDSELVGQLRVELFGFGLGWGAELRSLRDIIGGNDQAISLYQSFKDPQSVLGEREYSFMAVGPLSPLSFSGSPMFLTALKYPDEFLGANKKDKSGK
jgi:hypothetical protein